MDAAITHRDGDGPQDDEAWEDSQVDRATAMLRLLTRDRSSRPEPPQPDPAEWGARRAVARSIDDTTASVSIYLFDNYWRAREAEERLRDAAPPGRVAVVEVNGPLMLWATAEAQDGDGAEVLDHVQSMFAGDE